MQRLADTLITPTIKKLHPKCGACGNPTQVGHHWIEKSRSSRLRYDIDLNIIPLCNSCHSKIHNLFGNSIVGGLDVADIIRKKRGEDWYNKVREIGREIIKTDLAFYEQNYERLKQITSTDI